ncbi:MAG: hypothetical protein M3Y08_02300 [Fibrobacterota bacterium]|nr:hypothetical protein [Fibrobacterota bacterium]
MDMILDVEREAVELKYSEEISQGMFRKQIPHFAPAVVRELLVNAVAHRAYTISGDIFLEVHPDRFEISNPGGLPLGITESNILHQRHRRNPHLITLLTALGLMEGEGSGYDLIYQSLARDAKPFPEIHSDFNRTTVILESRILDPEAIRLCEYLDSHYQLNQREILVCGLLAREKKMLSLDLAKALQLEKEERLRSYVGRLLDRSILVARGIKKGTEYLLNPLLYGAAKINLKASLKTMEPAALKALIQEDLKMHPGSRISEINFRIPDLDRKDIRKAIYSLKSDGVLVATGPDRSRVYRLAKKK